jgi:hypothetical protein
MTPRWLILGAVLTIPLALLAVLAMTGTDVDAVLTEAQESVGLPPEAANAEWGEVPTTWEGPMLPGLPVAFDLPPGTDRGTMLDFYRARCAALGASSYGFGLEPDQFGGPSAMCTFERRNHRVMLDFEFACAGAACSAIQTVFLAN